jgi:hypothetical protein
MMLRASVEATNVPLHPPAITGPGDPLVPGGVALNRYVDAVLVDRTDLDGARSAVLADVGPDGLVDADGVIGNFEMMNRIADATGMPVGKGSLERTAEWRRELDIDRFRHA